MTVAQITATARSIADIPGGTSTFFTDTTNSAVLYNDAAVSIQNAWEEMYQLLIENNDDYFLNYQYFDNSGYWTLGNPSAVVTGANGTITVTTAEGLGAQVGQQVVFYSSAGVLRTTTPAIIASTAVNTFNDTVTITFDTVNASVIVGDTAKYIAPKFVADPSRRYLYQLDLSQLKPSFYRLRMFQYSQTNDQLYQAVNKMSNNDGFGNTTQAPAYRLHGSKLALYMPYNFNRFYLAWYPTPVNLYSFANVAAQGAYDFVTPYNIIPEILSYQVACDMRRKQSLDYSIKEARKNELIASMKALLNRDDAKPEVVKDVMTSSNFYIWR